MSDVEQQTQQATEQAPPSPAPTDAAPAVAEQGKTFTQADVDRIISERLERQKAAFKAQQDKAAEEAKAATLKEQGEFKALYEAEQKRAAELADRIAAQERAALVRRVAKAAGLDPDDEDLTSRLRGETEEDLLADAKKLAARLAPAQVPNLNGTSRPSTAASDPKAREEDIRRRFRIS